ncbi:MAG: chromosomal replication initiator protein DnaA, partial [Candidatus Competibacteraceae bacterium]|nr:chromosomal replication initiator protein DnaA [Candidatus Competibacteraceae bacterium]
YGQTGLGKTHLMQAIGHDLLSRQPHLSVVFISSEQFTNQLIQSIAEKSTQRFRTKYRKVDVLLIDDIHFIAGKEATQEEFFHTFNVLFDMHKQIVISSDRSPKEIKGIEERLVSRFEWGLVTDIQPPDLETRIAILQNKAREENLTVPQEVVRYIATYITSNIRELEGAMIAPVLAYSRLTEQKITLTMVEEVLRDLIGSEKIKPITVEMVQRAVADHFDVRIADLRGRSRQRQVVQPRQMAMYLCKEMIPSLSLNDVGEAFWRQGSLHRPLRLRQGADRDEGQAPHAADRGDADQGHSCLVVSPPWLTPGRPWAPRFPLGRWIGGIRTACGILPRKGVLSCRSWILCSIPMPP